MFNRNKEIELNRVSATGKGEQEIRNRCLNNIDCSDIEHEYNRRTEFRVLSISPNVSVQYVNNAPAVTDNSYLSKKSSRSNLFRILIFMRFIY